MRLYFGTKPDNIVSQSTSKRHGRSRQQWDKKIPERLEIIRQRSGATIPSFLTYQTAFYTDSSEALHGSLYGITGHLGHLGIYEPHEKELDSTNVQVNADTTRAILLWLSGELLNELIKVVNSEKLCSDLVEIAQKNSHACEDISRVVLILTI